MRRRLALLAVLSALPIAAACSSDGSSTDAGTDAPRDGAPVDAGRDMSSPPVDAGMDVQTQTDGGSDAPVDAPSDAKLDAPSDSATEGGADAAVDATADASDGGGSIHKTITCDGTITANEWGGAQHQFTTNGGQQWSMAWNATNLYVALTNAQNAEGIVLYLRHAGGGITGGQNYDGTAPSTLPFAANAVVYAKNNYQEVRTVSGNAWGAPVTNAVTFCGAMGNNRELVIPWSALGANVIPGSFRWLAYATAGNGFVYGQVPQTNPSGAIGTMMAFPDNYFVSSTANGGGAFPFAVVE